MLQQATSWILTIPHALFTPYKPPTVKYIKGQLESGEGGFLHWQVVVYFERNVRLNAVRKIFGAIHCEPTKSAAADAYVWKEETRVARTQFELGEKSFKRNDKRDWERIRDIAKSGRLDELDGATYVQHYRYIFFYSRTLQAIAKDHLQPVGIVRRVEVYWGPTEMGKSRRAWAEAGWTAFPKDPRTKFWDGYRGQKHVVLDEFRGNLLLILGAIDIAHILRWCDRYPVIVETKGSATVLLATHIWISSNLHPRDWYPGLDDATLAALLRRLHITHFDAL